MASLCVVMTHSVIFFGSETYAKSILFVRDAGYYGVIFFYVLSGFLITFLLLTEKKGSGTIDLRAFYRRRILRIWPLYYLIILLSFFVLPFIWPWMELLQGVTHVNGQLLLYLLFLPNLATYAGPNIVTCFQTYTIGYEEQFYLIWPQVMRVAKKYLMPVMLVLFFGHLLLELIHLYIRARTQGQPGAVGTIRACLTFINNSNFPAFVAGGMAAYIYLYGPPGLTAQLKRKVWTVVLSICVLVLMTFIRVRETGFVNIVGLVFACLILNLVLRDLKTGVFQRLLARCAAISYGIYIFHPAVFILVSAVLRKSLFKGLTGAYPLYMIISVTLIIVLSAVSYRYLELPFLRRKYTLRPSGGEHDKIR